MSLTRFEWTLSNGGDTDNASVYFVAPDAPAHAGVVSLRQGEDVVQVSSAGIGELIYVLSQIDQQRRYWQPVQPPSDYVGIAPPYLTP